MLICPVCGNELTLTENSFCCKNRHSFDKSKEGYVNLLSGRHKNGSFIGDNRDMAHSRRAFLQQGYYDFLAWAIADMINAHCSGNTECRNIVDISCGEGYYTDFIKRKTGGNVCGFDISKEMIRLAAKKYKDILFFVANIAKIPIADNSIDCAFQICAPFHEREFVRILKKDGILISVVPGKRHLWGLKELLYATPYENNEDKTDYSLLSLQSSVVVRCDSHIVGNDAIQQLFSMTPYYYKTSESDKSKLNKTQAFQTPLEFVIRTFTK